MKRWYFAVCALLFTSACSQSNSESDVSAEDRTVRVLGATSERCGDEAAAALRHVTALVLGASGARAVAVAPPAACAPPASADSPRCLDAALAFLADGAADAALLPLPATRAPAAWALRDAGLEELGDAAPPSRRSCFATAADDSPARSLLDLTDRAVARLYSVPLDKIRSVLTGLNNGKEDRYVHLESSNCTSEERVPEWCRGRDRTCATLLTSDESETNVLMSTIESHRLYATAFAAGPRLLDAAALLNDTAIIICDWTPEETVLARISAKLLGPPPCRNSETPPCPFETRRLVKYANVRSMARVPSAIRALVRLSLTAHELQNLTVRARVKGSTAAAQNFLREHPTKTHRGEVRVVVMLPNDTRRQAYDASALTAAAVLAEEDIEAKCDRRCMARFKVEIYDDRCAATKAYKYLIDALGTGEYGALSAVAGPACGAAFADVSRQSPAHALPVLAYTAQAPSPDARYALLAAGDARLYANALGALAEDMRWRRLAVISEPATRTLVDAARLGADVTLQLELPDDKAEIDYDFIAQWAKRVASIDGRIIYACLEDARAVRAALCAGLDAGLTPAAGVVWMLPATLPPTWLAPSPDDRQRCSRAQLERMAAGHLSVVPEWLARWQSDPGHRRWHERWLEYCRRRSRSTSACAESGPHAALLYDTLHLWADGVDRLLRRNPMALDDMHDRNFVSSLIEDTTNTNFTGLTGKFEWTSKSRDVYARVSSLLLLQWQNGSRAEVGRFENDALTLNREALRWYTLDGAQPDDGGERCGLQPLADLFRTNCRMAFVSLSAFLLAVLAVALAGAAFYCKRRIERDYRRRLTVLGLRSLSPKTIGLDRWEIPRERVVINRKLGMGAFGTVYGGHALLVENRGWTAVAVKTLKAGASTEEKLDFLSEAEAMKRFEHKNVVRLLGVVTKTEPVCTVMEFMLYGDLKNYLLARRHLAGGADDAGEEVSPRRLTSMALDVARALSYLAQLRYVHRDVAARNCLVSAHRVVKLGDFGMTRLVFENDYYRFSRKGMLPVRWMAPESLGLGVFSPASDIWSYGILLYEIVTFGSLPFQGLSNSEVLARVKSGHTLELPPGLKPQLEGLIKSCWQHDYRCRPGASEVAAFLADSPRLLSPCLDVPLDALPLDAESPSAAPWRLPRDRAEAGWLSWAAPASAATDTTYLSADAAAAQLAHDADEADAFLT